MENSFASIIEQSNSILILLPNRPYFDQVAAGLALFLSLHATKNTSIACSGDMLVEFNRLVGVNKITKELGNKNLVIRFADYQATNIERVSYDIENGEFKLTVIPKPGITPPQKNQVDIAFSGVAADVVILIGGGNESHFSALGSKDLSGAKKVHIGVKTLASSNQDIISLAKYSSCISELIYTLIKESGFEFDPDIATNLILGIEVGTNNFSTQSVTADTFQVVAELLRAGGKRQTLEPKQHFPPGAIPGQVPIEPIKESENVEEAPQDWLGPKIYKGTSVS